MMRRRLRRKASWIWADRQTLDVTDGAGTAIAAQAILPPGRVNWLLNNQFKRNSLTVKSILLWLDFHWWSTLSGPASIPDAVFYVMKVSEDEIANESFVYDPFVQPQVPANITAWGDSPADGLDAFLWSHYVKGLTPPNAVVNVRNTGAGVGSQHSANQTFLIDQENFSETAFVCRTFRCTAEWQPDVHIRSKRRLQRDEGLILGMFVGANAATPTNTGVKLGLAWTTRILAS